MLYFTSSQLKRYRANMYITLNSPANINTSPWWLHYTIQYNVITRKYTGVNSDDDAADVKSQREEKNMGYSSTCPPKHWNSRVWSSDQLWWLSSKANRRSLSWLNEVYPGSTSWGAESWACKPWIYVKTCLWLTHRRLQDSILGLRCIIPKRGGY